MRPDGRLILELPFSYIRDWTGARGRGRPREKVKDSYRVDIALLNARGNPIHVIEVKQTWDARTGFGDIRKLRDLLATFGPSRDGTLKSVFLSVWRQGRNRPCLDEKIDDVETKVGSLLRGVDRIVGHRFHRDVRGPVTRDKDGRDWEYGSHIIELFRRNRRKE